MTVTTELRGVVSGAAALAARLAAWKSRAASRRVGQPHATGAEPGARPEIARRLTGETDEDGRELHELLTDITTHAERLVARLAPSDENVRDALAVRNAATRAAQLTAPRHRTSDRPQESAARSDRAPADAPPSPRVLVVEDEPGVREFIRLVLTRSGHDVVTADSPRAALATLNGRTPISLMLVDVVMPEMDGFELVVEARRIVPGIHVVFTSAFAPDPERLPGSDRFLAKPFTAELLSGTVAEALLH